MAGQDIVELLDTNELIEYINTFYGYGDWNKAKFWFIGIEEGGGYEFANILARLESWKKLNKTDLIDCHEHHCNTKSFTLENSGKLHSRTWTRLIKTKLGYLSGDTSNASALEIQQKDWGALHPIIY